MNKNIEQETPVSLTNNTMYLCNMQQCRFHTINTCHSLACVTLVVPGQTAAIPKNFGPA